MPIWPLNHHLLHNSRLAFKVSARFKSLFANGSVFLSTSKQIFANLALEDWIYRNAELTDKKVMLLWLNGPSIVIGRHQNPWLECNVGRCAAAGVAIARRNSGGGTVYHDLGNLNISFVSSKRLYNRRDNLLVIRETLGRVFGVECRISSREDLVIDRSGHKISGSASKLGATNAYHHCTLLLDVCAQRMRSAIKSDRHSNFNVTVDSKATKSVPSPTINLKSLNDAIETNDFINELSLQFFKTQTGDDGFGFDGIQELSPDSITFPGIEEIEHNLKSWEWIYGKTPRFTVRQEFKVDSNADNWIRHEVVIEVVKGRIEMVNTQPFELEFNSSLIGIQFSRECVQNKINELLTKSSHRYDSNRFLCDCIIKCVDQLY